MTGKRVSQAELAAGLRTDGLGTLIGGIFNTFPYTSFSQNVGLVGVTGREEPLGLCGRRRDHDHPGPAAQDGRAGRVHPDLRAGWCRPGDVRHGGGHRHPHPHGVDFRGNRNNLYIVALSASASGLMPLVAPRWTQQMAHSLHPLLESGILLTAITAVVLNLYFNGGREDKAGAIEAAKAAEAH
jgi:xanthine/uracil permease